MPYVSVVHDRGAPLIVCAGIRKIRVDLDIRHRDMEEVNIHPAIMIKPYLYKEIRVV